MMARSISSNTRPDIGARPQILSHDFPLQRTAGPYIHTLGSSAFRLSTTTVVTSLAGSCFSPESAHRPFQHGIRGRGGTILRATLPSAGPSGLTNSPHPSSREGHHSRNGQSWRRLWSAFFAFLLSFLLGCCLAAEPHDIPEVNWALIQFLRCSLGPRREGKSMGVSVLAVEC